MTDGKRTESHRRSDLLTDVQSGSIRSRLSPARLIRAVGGGGGHTRTVAWTGVALVTSQVLLAATGIISARALGPAGKGVVVAALAWPQMLGWIGLLGLHTASSVRVASAPQRNLGSVLFNAVGHSTVTGGTLALAAVLILPRLIGHLGPDAARVATVAALMVPIAMLSDMLLSIRLGLGQPQLVNLSKVAGSAICLVATWVVWAVGRLDPLSAVACVVGGALVPIVIAAWGLPWRQLAVDAHLLLADIRFGVKVVPAGLLGLANVRLDVLLMSVLSPASSLGLYNLANSAMIPVATVGAAAAMLLTPAIARLALTNGGHLRDMQVSMIKTEAAKYLAVAVVGGVLLAIAAPLLIPVLAGSAFQPSILLVWILIPGYAARAYALNVVAGAVGMRRTWVGNATEGFGFVTTVLALPPLLLEYGALGAAIASTLSYIVSALVAFIAFRTFGRSGLSSAANREGSALRDEDLPSTSAAKK